MLVAHATAAAGNMVVEGIVLLFLIIALAAKEITGSAGSPRLVRTNRALDVAIVPLTVAVCLIVVQQIHLVL